MTSENADAFCQLLKLLNEVVKTDTGRGLRFKHIDGEGIRVLLADGHLGQGMGE